MPNLLVEKESQEVDLRSTNSASTNRAQSAGALSWGEKPTVSVPLLGLSATHLNVDITEYIQRNVDSQFDPLKHKNEHTHTQTCKNKVQIFLY
jgi:hypothetical protein